ncbi:dipeptidyl peptidase III [Byssothecium circinans]|uniref:Dipeptidyl peptidase III n=1 Tax=Byssothecium circinans TaxID=147558 RepID=A0A6A5UGD2_9PLEO|nr:dipeptidyl peptidase III [Byssothecium circinans]
MAPLGVDVPTTAVHQLAVTEPFSKLQTREKLYAHHFSNACWHGSKIVMRQVSKESPAVFALIMEINRAAQGEWSTLNCTNDELNEFLEYAALFLCNGPLVRRHAENRQRLASAASLFKNVAEDMYSKPPYSLGYPSDKARSNYYPDTPNISRDEIALVSKVMAKHSIGPENTRLRKLTDCENVGYELLQASVESTTEKIDSDELSDGIKVVRGDHREELSRICDELLEAKKFAANDAQVKFLSQFEKSFRTGSLEAFQEAQKTWVTDHGPAVENMIGFVEPYRDPHGVRAEWEGFIGIRDPGETEKLAGCVENSTAFIRLLPWAVASENDGKGPFEKGTFEPPDLTILHALTVCYSSVFEASNVPNYNNIRESHGFKNLVIANRLSANHNPANPCHYVLESDKELFMRCTHIVRFIMTAVHELLGHGTGKLLSEDPSGQYNFDKDNAPTNPLTERPVDTWYLPGQTWTGIFEDIATSVDECRATLVSEYLMDNKELLAIFGYVDGDDISPEDLTYITYVQIGVEGLQALEHYNVENQAWGEAHKQGHFAIFKYLCLEGDGVLLVEHDEENSELKVRVESAKLLTHGKKALGDFLLKLHIWRCTADVKSCRELYEKITAVEGDYEEWRQIFCSKPEPRWKFVQANTFREGDDVKIKVYEESNKGIIQSWAERVEYLQLL